MSRRRSSNSAPLSLFSFQDLITSLSGILILIVLLMSIHVAVQDPAHAPRAAEDEGLPIEALRNRVEDLRGQLRKMQATLSVLGTTDVVKIATDDIREERRHGAVRAAMDGATRRIGELTEEIARVELLADAARQRANDAQLERSNLQILSDAALDRLLFVIPEPGSGKTPVLVECSGASSRLGYIDKPGDPLILPPGRQGMEAFRAKIVTLSPSREYIVFMIKPSGVGVFEELWAIADGLGFDVGYDALEEDRVIAFGSPVL
jgi:hypothetical protein